MLQWGLLRGGATAALPPDASRPRLRRAAHQPGAARRSAPPTPTARSSWPCPPSTSTWRSIHMNRCRRPGQRPVPRPRPLLRRPLLHGGEAPLPVLRDASWPTADLSKEGSLHTLRINRMHGRRCDRSSRRRALHRVPAGLRIATRPSRRSTRPRPRTPKAWEAFKNALPDDLESESAYQEGGAGPSQGGRSVSDATRAEVCSRRRGRGLPRRRRDPGQLHRHRARRSVPDWPSSPSSPTC